MMEGFKGHPGPVLSFDLPDKAAARKAAQEIADRSGQRVVVTDDKGNEICAVDPQPKTVSPMPN